jgi:cytochrome c oxidase cbb3-type subunit 2
VVALLLPHGGSATPRKMEKRMNNPQNKPISKFSHEMIEKNVGLLLVLVILVVSFGGLVEIVPLFFQKSTTQPVAGMKPYSALQLAGRDVYLREGCFGCHSQMIRPFRAETERYGHYSVPGESVYDLSLIHI